MEMLPAQSMPRGAVRPTARGVLCAAKICQPQTGIFISHKSKIRTVNGNVGVFSERWRRVRRVLNVRVLRSGRV